MRSKNAGKTARFTPVRYGSRCDLRETQPR